MESKLIDEIKQIEVVDEEFIDKHLFFNAKLCMNEAEQKDYLVLAHYFADIANFDSVFKKFLIKKRVDILNHPYFKKLNEISKEKLIENL